MNVDGLEAFERRIAQLEADVARLSGPHIELSAGSVAPTGEVVEGPHAEVILAEGPPPGETVTDWLARPNYTPALVVDPTLARRSPCIRLEVDDGRQYVFSPGIIGSLSESDEAAYCGAGYEERTATEDQRQRLAQAHAAAEGCAIAVQGLDPADQLDAYQSCLAEEARRSAQ